MSVYLEKSKSNIDAAEILIKTHKIYIPSIHCSYYSCLQVIIHILYEIEKWDYSQIKKECERAEHGSHTTMLNIIKENILSESNNHSLVNAVNTKFGLLKELRQNADYYDQPFSDNEWKGKSGAALDLSRDLVQKLYVNIINKKKKSEK